MQPDKVNKFRSSWGKIVLYSGMLVVCVSYILFIRGNCAFIAGGSDSSGYANIAHQLMNNQWERSVPKIQGLVPPAWDYSYQQPLGFTVDGKTGKMSPTYPVGLPLHLTLASLFVGLDHAAIVSAVSLALAAAVLMVLLARSLGLPLNWSLAGAAILWACPLFAFMVLQLMSDAAAMVWAMAAIYLALQARKHWRWAFLAGIAVSIAILVRPTNLLLIIPITFAVGFRYRAWFALILGGVPGALFLAYWNVRCYGAVFTSGYGDISSLFGTQLVMHNIGHYILWISLLLTPMIALPAVGLMTLRKTEKLSSKLLAIWAASFISFYLFNNYSGEAWSSLRYILPAFPAIILAGLLVGHRWCERITDCKTRTVVSLGAFCCVLITQFYVGKSLKITDSRQGEYTYLHCAKWAEANLPSNAILMEMQLSGAFTYYTHFTLVRWDFLNSGSWDVLKRAAKVNDRPIYAVVYDYEIEPGVQGAIKGDWAKVAQVRNVNVWKLKD
jgi:hypothetical protein